MHKHLKTSPYEVPKNLKLLYSQRYYQDSSLGGRGYLASGEVKGNAEG